MKVINKQESQKIPKDKKRCEWLKTEKERNNWERGKMQEATVFKPRTTDGTQLCPDKTGNKRCCFFFFFYFWVLLHVYVLFHILVIKVTNLGSGAYNQRGGGP